MTEETILMLPLSMWPKQESDIETKELWYRPTEVIQCKWCSAYREIRGRDEFGLSEWQKKESSERIKFEMGELEKGERKKKLKTKEKEPSRKSRPRFMLLLYFPRKDKTKRKHV